MPIGIERINARRKQPNDRITFIKALEGPDKAYAEDFLERIAAICNPIMKANHISIMTLEEYEPNREFVGRNFNSGEIIQLVLKANYTGHWLPFRYVQMVMMHELAHCKQMNHSRAFWKVRNQYADELRVLWTKGYSGEGLWSRGHTLYSGEYERNTMDIGEQLPEHLCGGTYRSSRKRRRKTKPKLTYKEQKERRIAKKFGVNGMILGADEDTKVKLENGKRPVGKPRVAGSIRGRELRAAAALARFETQKEDMEPPIIDEEEGSGSETESEDDVEAALDINGKKLLDGNGRGMIKVCEDEDEDKDDTDARNEMLELCNFESSQKSGNRAHGSEPKVKQENHDDDESLLSNLKSPTTGDVFRKDEKSSSACPVCSMENNPSAPTCIACANVLDPSKVPGTWRCKSEVCDGGAYVNAADCGVCGVCGSRKCS